jgi:acyl-coenzyme A synthetase/AMP-(fatty) acid ligase
MIKAWHESGERVWLSDRLIRLGHYTVQGFADDVLTVGCHQIPYFEIERIAAQLGL